MALFMRVGYFVLERIAEPVADLSVRLAHRSPTFRQGCTAIARSAERFERGALARRNRRSLNPLELVTVTDLTDEQAASRGAEIVGEGTVWALGLAVVLHQYLQDEDTSIEAARVQAACQEQHETAVRAALDASELRVLERIASLERTLAALADEEERRRARKTWWRQLSGAGRTEGVGRAGAPGRLLAELGA